MNNPENNSLKVIIIVLVLVVAGYFVYKNMNSGNEGRVIGTPSSRSLPTGGVGGTGYAVADGQACTHQVSGGGSVSGTTKGGKCCAGVGGTEYCYSDFNLSVRPSGTGTNPSESVNSSSSVNTTTGVNTSGTTKATSGTSSGTVR